MLIADGKDLYVLPNLWDSQSESPMLGIRSSASPFDTAFELSKRRAECPTFSRGFDRVE
jgi:hypothetical protein